jgi:phosphohistidine phosphatase SixA
MPSLRISHLLLFCIALFSLSISYSFAASETDALKAARAGGVALLIRHMTTVPGVGDPPGYKLSDCSTQRNLSDVGREEARRLGPKLQTQGIRVGEVYASTWCRAIDSAQLAFGRHTVWPALNSFFDDPGTEPKQSAEVRKRLAKLKTGDAVPVLMTHQVNISALTGVVPAMGGIVVVKPDGRGGLKLIGELPKQ